MQVSAVILTLNEETNIGRCLASLEWCDDIVVVDSGSTDRTLEICAEYGVRIVHNPFVDFAAQRNFALETLTFRHEWILHLDADEEATPAFHTALAGLDPAPGIFGYRVPSRTLLFGQWLKRSGMYPSYQVRIGHRAHCTFYQHGHGQRETLAPDQVGLFDVPYDHHAFSHGLVKWFIKHVGYARAEADQILHAAASTNQPSAGDATRPTARAQTSRQPHPAGAPAARTLYLSGGLAARLARWTGRPLLLPDEHDL